MNILTAVSQLRAVTALFAEAGLKLEDFLALKDPTALKAHLATLTPAAPAITAEHPEVAALIKTATEAAVSPLNTSIGTLNTQLSAFNTGLAAAGVALAAAPAGHTAEQITAAITARASLVAQEQLAKRGLARFPDSTPSSDPLNPKATGPKTMTRDAFNALSPADKMKFSSAGGRLVE